MSIASEINRIQQNVSDSLSAVAAKGVTVPQGSNSDDLPDLIAQIQQGGSGGIVITDAQDAAGGTVRTITAVEISGTKQITANGTGIDVTEYAAVNVNVPSGGPDMPTITVTFDDNWEQIISASFDKTYSECVAYIDDGITIANVITVNQSGTEQYPAQATLTISGGSSYQTYTVLLGVEPGFDVKYNSNGTVEITNPSALRETLNITSNGTYYPTPLRYIEEVNVNVPSSQPNLQTKTHITPTESSQTIEADTGYDALSSVQIDPISSTYVGSGITQRSSSDLTVSGDTVTVPVGYYQSQVSKAVASGSATAPASISGTSATVSTGTNTLTLTKTVSVTPSVTAGYVSSGTAGNSSVSLQASVTTKAAATIHPSTSDQTIASGTYTTGAQTIKAVTLANLTADNIKNGVTVTVGDSTDADCVASVTGTYEGGGSGKNAQASYVTGRATTSTYTAVGPSITVAKTGTYDVYWSGYRSSTSGTSGTQLYIDGTAYGTAQTSFNTGSGLTNTQNVHLSDVSLTQGQVLTIHARSRGNNYYMYVQDLTIIEA